MSTPTATPRTDAALYPMNGVEIVWPYFARQLETELARLRAELAVAENWVEHHSKHADDLIGENVKLRAEVERLKDGGVQRIKDALATALDTRDAAIARAERAEAALAFIASNGGITHETECGPIACTLERDQLRAEVERLRRYFTGRPADPT